MALKKALALASALMVVAGVANAVTITFDESPATSNNSPYGATLLGATFSATNAGTQAGISNGDFGNWGLQGTNGPQFLGFNATGAGYSESVTFSTSVNSASLDFSRSNSSSDGTVTLRAFDGAALLGSTSVVLGPINTWATLSLAFPNITSISWEGTGSYFHPYGVDNFTFNPVPVPPAAFLFPSALGLLGWARRKPQGMRLTVAEDQS